MTETPDAGLLEQFVRDHSEAAFEQLVRRHVALVHSVALRHTANAEHARDITQAVFIILARKAATLGRKTVLPGWLYHAARLTAANFQRAELRRVRREQEACMQSLPEENPTEAVWRELSPQLDEAMACLGAPERDALVLRYFQNKSIAEVGQYLGLTENTAQKRVSRALEKLRRFFTRRGVTLSAALVAGTLAAHSVQAAPAALAQSVAAGALHGAALSTSTSTLINGALKIMAWTKAKIAITTAAAVLLTAGTSVVVIKHVAPGIGNSATARVFTNGLNLAGAIPDAIYTYPDGDEKTHHYLEAIMKQFGSRMGPGRTIKSDRELTEDDLQTHTIYIYGSPENHRFFQRVRDQLPIVFMDDGVGVGGKKCVGRDVGAIFVCPNPINPQHRLVVYGTVSPEALTDMNSVFHGPTDYIVFNHTTRHFKKAEDNSCFLLAGGFDKTDPAHWRVDDKLEATPPAALRQATASVIVAR